MKGSFINLMLVLLFLGGFACTYDKQTEVWCIDPPEAVLPDSVGLGESVLYLNGEKVAWTPEIYLTVTNLLNFSFSYQDPYYPIYSRFGFGAIPLRTGAFEVISLDEYIRLQGGFVVLYDKVLAGFSNFIANEDIGFEYREVDLDQAFFQVQALDTINRTAIIKFKAKFCLENRNGYRDVGLPATLLFQGVMNEVY